MAGKILVVDDDDSAREMTMDALTVCGYQVKGVSNGIDGIREAEESKFDLVVLDVTMPVVDGYEVCRRLRANTKTAHLPVIMLTAQDSVEDKVRGLEVGADDYLTKPFQRAELDARVKVMLRRAAAARPAEAPKSTAGSIISVYSLRGGVGVSTIAANLAVCLMQLWKGNTILSDLVLTGGISSFLFNLVPRNTWVDLAAVAPQDMDDQLIANLLLAHDSGISVLAAPQYSEKAKELAAEQVAQALNLLKQKHPYIVVDLPHDFREITRAALRSSDAVVVVVAPELASISTTRTVLELLKDLDIPRNKLRLVLNQTVSRNGVEQKQVEHVLDSPVDFVVPFSTDVVDAINGGNPVALASPTSPVTEVIEEIAFHVSQEDHQKEPPKDPTKTWQRVSRRIQSRSQKGLRRLFT